MANGSAGQRGKKKPLPANQVVQKVQQWLKIEGNVESLKTTYEQADRKTKELTEMYQLPAEAPRTVALGDTK